MTISSEVRKAGPFTGTGVATEFPFAFKVFTTADLYAVTLNLVTEEEDELVLTMDYSVALNEDQNSNPGGTVTLNSPLAAGYQLLLTSDLSYTQPTDLTNQGGFYPKVIADALDREVVLVQQLKEASDRSLKIPLTSAGINPDLPAPEAGSVIGWDAAGMALQNWSPGDLATTAAYGDAVVDTFVGATATVDFTLSFSPGSINNLFVSVGGVVQAPVTDYSWPSEKVIRFTVAPPVGEIITVRYFKSMLQGTIGWEAILGKPNLGYVDIVSYGADVTGTVSAVAALTAACATGKPVMIPSGTYKIDSDYTCSAPLIFQGGIFAISTGKTLTLTGPQEGVSSQRFSGSGVASFAGNKSLHTVSPEWWGATVNSSSFDNSSALNAMTAAMSTLPGITAQFSSGSYYIASKWYINARENLSFKGSGGRVHYQNYGTVIRPTNAYADEYLVDIYNSSVIAFDGINLYAQSPDLTYHSGVIVHGNNNPNVFFVTWDNFSIRRANIGYWIGSVNTNDQFQNCTISNFEIYEIIQKAISLNANNVTNFRIIDGGIGVAGASGIGIDYDNGAMVYLENIVGSGVPGQGQTFIKRGQYGRELLSMNVQAESIDWIMQDIGVTGYPVTWFTSTFGEPYKISTTTTASKTIIIGCKFEEAFILDTADITVSVSNSTFNVGAGYTLSGTDDSLNKFFYITDPVLSEATATLTCGTSGTITLNASLNKMKCTKMGRVVTFTGYLQADSVSSPLGELVLGGLPYTIQSGTSGYFAGSIIPSGLGVNTATSVALQGMQNTTTAKVIGRATIGGTAIGMASFVSGSSGFVVSGSYITN